MINQLVERVASRPHARAVAGTAGANVAITLIGSLGGLFIARVLGPTRRGDLVIILQWPAIIGTMAGINGPLGTDGDTQGSSSNASMCAGRTTVK